MTSGGEFQALADLLARRFQAGVDEPWPDFEELALRVFRHQFDANPPYRAFAAGRRRTPETVTRWQEIPPVPASAFKYLGLVSGDFGRVERVFRTSGTTARSGRPAAGPQPERGAHHVLSVELYEAASMPNLAAHLVPEGVPVRILSLIPAVALQPESSLATMMSFALTRLGTPGSGTFAHPDTGVDLPGFAAALARVQADGVPVWVAGTAFAFIHWLDHARQEGIRVSLAEGSRLMETGGFKGRSREVPRLELYRDLEAALGIPRERMVNEYGMTELLSQFYEPVLRDGAPEGLDQRHHVGPPWVRTRVLHPETLEELPPGQPGLLCHLDLANVGSVAAVLTADLGLATDGGFRVLGRAPGAEPRGCSLALEELLEGGG